MLKLMRLRDAMNVARDILGQDLLNAAFWLDVRKLEKPEREFGAAPTAAWKSFRKIVPFRPGPGTAPLPDTASNLATEYLKTTPPSTFYAAGAIAMPGGNEPHAPLAQPTKAAR